MIYLVILYKDNGKIECREFLTFNALKLFYLQNGNKYMYIDVYLAKSVNNKIIDRIYS